MGCKLPLSVAIITKNEAEKLPDCLKSVDFADQIVVVDSGSSDETVTIATNFGCEVFTEDWRGFGHQKQSALNKCRHQWALVLDADERIPPETAAFIRNIVSNSNPPAAGYSFPRKNFFQGRWVKHVWGQDRVVRLFQRESGNITQVKIHESVEVSGPVTACTFPIIHCTEGNLSRLLNKINHYSASGAQEAFNEGKKASVWSAAFRACLTFFQDYFLKLGILDGVQGFTISISDSVAKFFKYAKLSELNKKRNQDKY